MLQIREIPIKILVLIPSLYSGSESAILFGSALSKYFSAATNVRQGCVLAPLLSNIYMDWVSGRTVEHAFQETLLGGEAFAEHDFADDAVIFAETCFIYRGIHERVRRSWILNPLIETLSKNSLYRKFSILRGIGKSIRRF